MGKRYSKEELRVLRNEIPIAVVISDLLKMEHKLSEGYFRFLCPICFEFDTGTNPKKNLARCFRCERNFNPIDMVMEVRRVGFLEAAEYLTEILRCRAELKKMLAEKEFGFTVDRPAST